MASGALQAGARVIAISRGGALAELARAHGALHVPCAPDVAMPRFALGELLAPIVVVLFRLGHDARSARRAPHGAAAAAAPP